MANCEAGCTCVIQAGDGVHIEGAGTNLSPLVISSDFVLLDSLKVQSTPTVSMFLVGLGTPESPFQLFANATIPLTQLSDVDDALGPVAGDVPVWVGTGSTGHWEFSPPPPNPPGAVNVGDGLTGDGSIGDPIEISLVGTSAGGTTSGYEVYVDASGNLRAVPPPAGTVPWTNISGKPTTFAPSAHTHPVSQISDSTSIGRDLVTAPDASTARSSLGAGSTGTAVFQASSGTAARSAIGMSTVGSNLSTASTVIAAREVLRIFKGTGPGSPSTDDLRYRDV